MFNTTASLGSYKHVPIGVCGLDYGAASYCYSAVLILLFLISSVENLVIIIAISKYKILHTRSILLLGIVLKVGFLNSCVVTAVKARMTMDHSNTWYDVFWWIFACLFVSLGAIVITCFERLAHVYFLDKYKQMSPPYICSSLLVLCVSPMILIFLDLDNMLVAIVALALFVIYLISVIIAMIGMVVTLKKHSTNVKNMSQEILLKYQWRALQTTLLIVSTFMAMNTPTILYIAFGFLKRRSRVLCLTTYLLILVNSVVNPWIYFLRIGVIRKHIFKMFRLEGFIRNELHEERRNGTLRINTDTPI